MDQLVARSTPPRSARSFAVSATVSHVGLTLLLVISLIFWVPRFERTFKEFNMKLPALTEGVITVSHWVNQYWYILIFPIGILLTLDSMLLFLLSNKPDTRRLGIYWLIFVTLLLGLALGIVALAIGLPGQKLAEGLSK